MPATSMTPSLALMPSCYSPRGKEFRGMNLKNALELMKGDVFVDLRNVYDPEPMRAMGFQYSCVGR